jgi:hypothetical protein
VEDSTWNHMRSHGRSWIAQGYHPRSKTIDTLRRLFSAARREGATWQEIADASMLSLSTVRKYSKEGV